MRFEVGHDFAAPRARVAGVLCDPAFQTQLDLPDLARPDVVEHTVDGTTTVLRLRYEYIGELNSVAKRIVGSRKLTWIQELRLDTATYRGTLSFAAEQDERRLNGAATIAITQSANGCRRRISGDLHVRVPLVGSTAEHRIVPGLVRRLDVEAAALTLLLAANP